MKNILVLLAIVGTVIVSSCSKKTCPAYSQNGKSTTVTQQTNV